MDQFTTGCLRRMDSRSGGYLNYQSIPGDKCLSVERANQLLVETNNLLEKYFPWIGDFVVFQLSDGTIRIDVADRQFLDGES